MVGPALCCCCLKIVNVLGLPSVLQHTLISLVRWQAVGVLLWLSHGAPCSIGMLWFLILETSCDGKQEIRCLVFWMLSKSDVFALQTLLQVY